MNDCQRFKDAVKVALTPFLDLEMSDATRWLIQETIAIELRNFYQQGCFTELHGIQDFGTQFKVEYDELDPYTFQVVYPQWFIDLANQEKENDEL